LKSAGAGGADDLEMNAEHRTSNAQHRMAAPRGIVQRSEFGVRCSVFAFAAVFLTAAGLFGQASTNALPALAPPHGELPPTFEERFNPTTPAGQAICISILVLAMLLFFVIWKKLHPPPPPTLPPEVQACEALAKLLRQPEDGKTLSEVSQILRRYIIAVLGLPPAKLTTAEICAALASQGQIDAERVQSISDFLRQCDERKFAPARSAAPLHAASRALELVALAEKRLVSAGRDSSVASSHQDTATK
jgi:hypothetical protein